MYHRKKQFMCTFCQRDFDKKRQLKNHMKDAHPDARMTLTGRHVIDQPGIQQIPMKDLREMS